MDGSPARESAGGEGPVVHCRHADLRVHLRALRLRVRGAGAQRRQAALPRLRTGDVCRLLSSLRRPLDVVGPGRRRAPARAARRVRARPVPPATDDPASAELDALRREEPRPASAACSPRRAPGPCSARATPHSDLMFVGEAPGYHEDQQGRPFVGQAGKLLEQLLATIGLTREQVYIANVLKSRPPNNRDPKPEEIEACQPYLLAPDRAHRAARRSAPSATSRPSCSPAARRASPACTASRSEAHRRAASSTCIRSSIPAAALYTPAMLETLKQDFLRLPEVLGLPLDDRRRRCCRRRRSAADDRLAAASSRPRRSAARRRPRRRPRGAARPSSSASSDACSPPRSPRRTRPGRSRALLAVALAPPALVTLRGDLGTGKTTLVREVLRALGVEGVVASPSFTLAQSYEGADGLRLHHLDLYRLSPGADAGLFAFDDYLGDARAHLRGVARGGRGGAAGRRCRRAARATARSKAAASRCAPRAASRRRSAPRCAPPAGRRRMVAADVAAAPGRDS